MNQSQIAKMRAQLKKEWRKHPELDWAQKSGNNLGWLNLTTTRVADASSFFDAQSMVHSVITGLCAKGATLDIVLGKKKFIVMGDHEVKPPVFLKPGDPILAVVRAKGGEFVSVRFSTHGYEIVPEMVGAAKQVVKEMLKA